MPDLSPHRVPEGPAGHLQQGAWPIWLIVTLPALFLLYLWHSGESTHFLIRASGEWAARFAIVTLMLTPLMIALPKQWVIRWLMHHRRHIGVAAFLYAALHQGLLAMQGSGLSLLQGHPWFAPVLTGWIAFLLFVILAALAMAIHWDLLERISGVLFFHFGPLLLFEAYRISWHMRLNARRRARSG